MVLFEVGTATFIYDGQPKQVAVTATLNHNRNYTGAPATFTMEIQPGSQKKLVINGMPGEHLFADYGHHSKICCTAMLITQGNLQKIIFVLALAIFLQSPYIISHYY